MHFVKWYSRNIAITSIRTRMTPSKKTTLTDRLGRQNAEGHTVDSKYIGHDWIGRSFFS